MEIIAAINNRIEAIGISIAKLSRRVHMAPEALRRSLKGARQLKAVELVAICHELGLELDDLDAAIAS